MSGFGAGFCSTDFLTEMLFKLTITALMIFLNPDSHRTKPHL